MGASPITNRSSESYPYILVHYNEIALKGRNRHFFEKRLRENIRRAVKGLGVLETRRLPGRIMMELTPEADRDAILGRLRDVFGISNFSPAHQTAANIETLIEEITPRVRAQSFASFAVRARRADKSFPLTSQQINERLGAAIVQATGAKVDLGAPALEVHVEILSGRAIYYFAKHPGAQGLPVGVGGKVAVMLSGGIDSPVAAARMMRRGCRACLIHFHSAPYTDAASQEKVREIARILTRFQESIRLYNVPFIDVQKFIVTDAPSPVRVLLYRRFMVRIAGHIAGREDAGALVTGESLGQVASQTLENLAAVGAVATLPILRPLVGWDKQEIIAEAERIGTYETSILPHGDCCSYLMPDLPATRSTAAALDQAEAALDVDRLVQDALRQVELVELYFGQPEKVSAWK